MRIEEPEKITLKQLLLQLPISKVWTVIIITAGLLTGSFSFGYQMSSSINEIKIARLELDSQQTICELRLEVSSLDNALEECRSTAAKERANALYLSYCLTRERYLDDSNPENLAEIYKTLDLLNEYIYGSLNSGAVYYHEGEVRDCIIDNN